VKSLYLHWHNPELRDVISPLQQAIFNQGTEVGLIAQHLFPGGVNSGINLPDDYLKCIEMTSNYIEKDVDVIYEAGFMAGNLLCFVDILVKDGQEWSAFEVKSSTNLKPVNILDAAFQYYVLKKAGLNVKEISIVLLNPAYEREGEIIVNRLFKFENITRQVIKLQRRIMEYSEHFLTHLNSSAMPDIDIGPHCFDPYDCDFHGFCWKHVPEYSVFDISRLSGEKKWDLYRKGILKFEDIPPDYSLNQHQWQQVKAELDQVKHINKDAIEQFVNNLQYPLYFLDFESFQPAIPLFDHSRPFQQIVFQFSLHILVSPGSELKHGFFLADQDGCDPRGPFIENLIRDIGEEGDIIVFNRSFEASRLKEIATRYPEYDLAVKKILNRIKDMMVLFQNRHYYVPEMRGSYSIKQVLPAMVPGFGYENLAITDGGAASYAFRSLLKESDAAIIERTRKNLLEYCKLDTLAMVEILRALIKNS